LELKKKNLISICRLSGAVCNITSNDLAYESNSI